MPSLHRRSVQLPDEHFETLKEIFGCKYEEKVVNGVKTRLMRDYYASNILKILLALSKNRLRYQDLFQKSKIRNEDAFLNYLRWMLKIGLLAKDGSRYSLLHEPSTAKLTKLLAKDGSRYRITRKGMKILDAFS